MQQLCYLQADNLLSSRRGHWHRSGDCGEVVDLGLINHSHCCWFTTAQYCSMPAMGCLLYLVNRNLVLIWKLGLVWHCLGHITDRCIVRHVVSHLHSIVQLIFIAVNRWVADCYCFDYLQQEFEVGHITEFSLIPIKLAGTLLLILLALLLCKGTVSLGGRLWTTWSSSLSWRARIFSILWMRVEGRLG